MRARSLLTTALTIPIIGLTVVSTAPVAAADTPGCVTKKEWNTAKEGYKMKGIHSRFDTKGTQTGYFPGDGTFPERQGRLYERCSGLAHVAIEYRRTDGYWRMQSKWGW